MNTEKLALMNNVKGTPVNITLGSHVWVEDPELSWTNGEVTEIKGTNATILTSDGKTVRSYFSFLIINTTLSSVICPLILEERK